MGIPCFELKAVLLQGKAKIGLLKQCFDESSLGKRRGNGSPPPLNPRPGVNGFHVSHRTLILFIIPKIFGVGSPALAMHGVVVFRRNYPTTVVGSILVGGFLFLLFFLSFSLFPL